MSDEVRAQDPSAVRFVPEPGAVLGPYTLEERLGRGSMGEVWRARGPDRLVALKIPLRPAFLRHLRQEGLFLETVDHPNVARFYEADLESEPPWLATELATGQPLRALCRGTIEPASATLICDQILAGLEAIHAAGILHLDLKPENVIVPDEEGGLVKIVDLGLGRATSKLMEEVYLSVSLASRVPQIAGTLAYMSPEQRKGKDVDCRADLFAFGILLHELLTGGLPEPGKAISDTREEFAPRWDVVVSRLTHPDTTRRPASARDARHLVSHTLTEKNRFHAPDGGLEPRDLLSFDEEALAAASPYSAGMVIGAGYELEELLGRGGFGEVWRARRGEEQVALKLILSDVARKGLQQEVEVARRIKHPNVPKVLDDRSHEETAHVVFELVRGTSLRLTIHEEEQLPLAAALEVFEGMLDVVKACSSAGVVHMDLKPEHFLVDWDASPPQVSLIDFGLAALCGPRSGLSGSLASRAEVRGTLDYMAPEQRAGKPPHPAVDVYALGLCLFELLVFSLPKGPQSLATLRREVPHEIDRLASKMLSAEPFDRPSLNEALRVVRAAREAAGRPAKRWRPRAASVSIAALIKHRWNELPLKLRGVLTVLIGLGLVVALVVSPQVLRSYREGSFSRSEVMTLGATDFAPSLDAVTALGELPARRGKVLILRAPISQDLAGLQRRPARLESQWASLSGRLRAARSNEVGTLLSLFQFGSEIRLSVYDMQSQQRVAHYELDGWPEFSFGDHGRIVATEFVELMPEAR